MGNNGGCGSVLIALLLVAVVFGAGYLFSQDTQIVFDKQVADAALVQAVQQTTALAAENEKARNALAEAEAAARTASEKAAASDKARDDAEARVAAAEARALEAEGKAAAADKARADAETRAVEAEQALAEAKQAQAQANAAAPDGSELRIPVTSGTGAPEDGKIITIWLIPGVGIAIFGLAAVTVGWKLLHKERRGASRQDESKDYTYVKMTREEARLYAQLRRK